MDERARRLSDALAKIRSSTDATRPNSADPVDVGELRRRLGMSQSQFARRFGFSVATLRHWEQGDRKPRGTARVLLRVIASNPRAVVKALTPV